MEERPFTGGKGGCCRLPTPPSPAPAPAPGFESNLLDFRARHPPGTLWTAPREPTWPPGVLPRPGPPLPVTGPGPRRLPLQEGGSESLTRLLQKVGTVTYKARLFLPKQSSLQEPGRPRWDAWATAVALRTCHRTAGAAAAAAGPRCPEPPGPPSVGDPAPPSSLSVSSLSVSPLGSLQAFVPTSPGQRDRPWPPAPRAPHAAPARPVPLSCTHLTRHFADPSAVRATRADVPPRPLLRPQRLTVLNQPLLNECMRG